MSFGFLIIYVYIPCLSACLSVYLRLAHMRFVQAVSVGVGVLVHVFLFGAQLPMPNVFLNHFLLYDILLIAWSSLFHLNWLVPSC